MSALSKVLSQVNRKASASPDGLTSAEASPTQAAGPKSGLFNDLLYQARNGTLGGSALTVLDGLVQMPGAGTPLDDRKLLLERGVGLLQHLPPGSAVGAAVSQDFIGMLWNDLPHPPASYIGPNGTYRNADGSGNNPLLPDLGKAGTPYARSVAPVRPKPAVLPDVGLVFDKLLRRDDTKFKEHPSGISSLFFSFATIVIHVRRECFQTSATEWWVNETSSYVDLSTLYGNNAAEQATVRTYDGTGTLHPDTVASARLMMMPPAVVVLVIFSRNHYTIASRILQINEKGLYSSEIPTDEVKRRKQDEDIFQKARNVNVAWFASIVLGDYVATILNTVRSGSDWSLDLGAEIIRKDGTRVERGGGNAVSIEFNVAYHWHAAMSQHDAAWTTAAFEKLFPGKDVTKLTPLEFYQGAGKHAQDLHATEPKTWTITGLDRGTDGRYADCDLAEILNNAVDEPAGAFGAHGSPAALRVVEILGQTRARDQWGVCTMNEFRKYLNLKQFETFEEWNTDPKVAAAARELYGHVDDLELYPGLLAEEPKPAMTGSGTCTGHTIGRGILDDAVSLVRSDRFLTHDLNTSTLTSWGASSIKKTPGAPGGLLPGLLFSALPTAYKFNSTYALLPFYTPKAAKEILTGTGKLALYTTDRHPTNSTVKSLHPFAACKEAFLDRDSFNVFYNNSIRQITDNKGFLIGFDDKARHDPPSHRMMAAFHQPNFEAETAKFFSTHADYHIKKSSLAFTNSATRQLDIVRDVCNVVPKWISNRFALPLKTEESPHGLFSIPELRLMLLGLFVFSSFSIIPSAGWFLRETSLQSSAALTKIIAGRIKTSSGIVDTITDFLTKNTAYEDSDESELFYKTLKDSGVDADQLAGDCIGVMIPIAGNVLALIVDLYLKPEYLHEKNEISRLSLLDTPASDALLLGYIREGMRLQGVVIGLPRIARVDKDVQDGDRVVHLKAGDQFVIGISKGHIDPAAFPNPTAIDPERPESAYILLGLGLHYCFGARLTWSAILATVKTIFKLKNLRRDPGRGGQFSRVTQTFADGLESHLYLDQSSAETPAPVNLHILYDAESIDSPTGEEAVKGIVLKAPKNAPKSPKTTSISPTPSSEIGVKEAASIPVVNRRKSFLARLGSGSVRRSSQAPEGTPFRDVNE